MAVFRKFSENYKSGNLLPKVTMLVRFMRTDVSNPIRADKEFSALYQTCSVKDSMIAFRTTEIDTHSEATAINKAHSKPPCVFLHGNPTSSFLWRNVLPSVSSYSACLAPDLIGMGKSGPMPSESYRFVDHASYLDEFFRKRFKENEKVTLIGHEWGAALAFYWAYRNPERVHAIIHMESIVAPFSINDFPASGRDMYLALRSPIGEDLVYRKNVFIKNVMPDNIQRQLQDEELKAYKDPYRESLCRKPMLQWARQVPLLEDGPADVISIADKYRRWLCTSDIPKLYIHASPGFYSNHVLKRTRHWRNQRVKKVSGHHYLQEDSPKEIANTIVRFLDSLEHSEDVQL